MSYSKVEMKINKCHFCNAEFQAKRSDAKYCSSRCRVSRHRKISATKSETPISNEELQATKEGLLKAFEIHKKAEMKKEWDRLYKLRDELEAAQKRIIAQQTSVNAFLSRADFKKIRALLHPDKHDNDPKYTEAFRIFNMLEKGVPKRLSKAAREKQGW